MFSHNLLIAAALAMGGSAALTVPATAAPMPLADAKTSPITVAGSGLQAIAGSHIARAPLQADVDGGETRVAVTADLAGLGLTAGLLGDATLVDTDVLTVSFPITGGELDADLAGQILHEGSGVSLTGGDVILNLENFIIDTTASSIFGDVSFGDTSLEDVALFSFDLSMLGDDDAIDDLDDPDIELFFTAASAGVLTDLFAAPDLTGATFGFAATAPEIAAAVPAPGAFGLLGLGILAIGVARRRR
ncbi:MAG: hypothetical protein WA979_07295 [Pacificimonas sp.]